MGPPQLDPAHDERRDKGTILGITCLDGLQFDFSGRVFLQERRQGNTPGVVGSKNQKDNGVKEHEARACLGGGERQNGLII